MANELTDSDRAAILAATRSIHPWWNGKYADGTSSAIDEAIYLAGKVAGIAEGLERAAKLADGDWWTDARGESCGALIRALKASA